MYIVCDTHALLWHLADDRKLSAHARTVFDAIERGENVLVIPSIVLLECLDIFEKKKVQYGFQRLVLKITGSRNFMISDLNWNLILETERTRGFKDLHDRVIVATARLFDAELLSRDRIVRRLFDKTVW
ncbi:MAG: PIN domain-containing protein [Patescibacteria group bacterium]